jgi:hypothetical protein
VSSLCRTAFFILFAARRGVFEVKFLSAFQCAANQICRRYYLTDSRHKWIQSCGQTCSSFPLRRRQSSTMPANALSADALFESSPGFGED